jgi:protein-tyrosine phosphatase
VDVLFVCTGNTCRSPMAEAILRHLVEDRGLSWTIGSAGLRAESDIAPAAVRALRRRGISVVSRAAVQLTEQLVQEASIVLCMTEQQRSLIAAAMPALATKVHSWGALVTEAVGPEIHLPYMVDANSDPAGYDIVDPAGGDDATYEHTATIIEILAALTPAALAAKHQQSTDRRCS